MISWKFYLTAPPLHVKIPSDLVRRSILTKR